MRKTLAFVTSVFIAFNGVILPASAAPGVPKILSHQGRLLDSSGNLLGGSGTDYCFQFSLYDDATVGGGDVKHWPTGTPSYMTVNVKNGVYNVGIGDAAAGGDVLTYDFQSNSSVYLDIKVAAKTGGTCGDETLEQLSPRQPVWSSGFAINSDTVDGFHAGQSATGSQVTALTDGDLFLGDSNPQINATGSNTLTLQGGAGTGDVNFFNTSNNIDASGNFTFAGTGEFSSYDCTAFANGGKLTTTASGVVVCADDEDSGGGGSGTVTSVNVSGGTTGLSFAGGPVTTSGTMTMSGTLNVVNGGTGLNTVALGDILYGSAANVYSRLPIGTAGQVLKVVGGLPVWSADNNTTYTAGTGINISGGNVISSTGDTTPDTIADNGSITLSTVGSEVTGILPIANGGTNLSTTPTNGQLLIGNGTGYTLNTITAGTGIGIVNGAGTITINNTGVTSVDASGGTTGLTFTGGPVTTTGTLTMSGVLGVANGGSNNTTFVDDELLAWDLTGNQFVSTGIDFDDVLEAGDTVWTADADAGSTIAVSNSTTVDFDGGLGVTTTIAGSVVTFDVVESELDLNNLSGVLSVVNGGTGLSTVALGDILYASAADTLSALNAGTAGQVLTIVGGVPAWQTPSGGVVYTAGTGINISGGNVISNTGDTTVDTIADDGNIDLATSEVDGVLGIANGGTNNTTFTLDELVIYQGGQLISSGVEFGDLVLDGEFLFDTAGDTGTSAIAQDGLVTFLGGTGIATADNGSGTITFTNTGDTTPDTIADDGFIDLATETTGSYDATPDTIADDGVIALGAETSGNYLANITSTGLTITGTPGEGWTANIECDDCILDTDDLWVLTADSGPDSDIALGDEVSILGTSGRVVTVNDGADTVTIDVVEGGLDMNELGGGPLEIANGGTNNTSFTSGDLVYFNGTSIVSTSIPQTSVITTTNISSNAVTSVTAGNGLTASASVGSITLDVDLLTLATDGASATVSSASGLEFVGAGNQLTLLQGCTNGDILKWDDTADEWECASDATGGTVNSFATWLPPNGSSPVASSPTDTMTLTNISGGITITGTAASDELDFSLAAGAADGDILVWDNDSSTWNVVSPGGDVSVDDDGVFSVNAVQNDAVTLGTDTVGNYLADVTSTMFEVTGTPGEGWAANIECSTCLVDTDVLWNAVADDSNDFGVTENDYVQFDGGLGIVTSISPVQVITFDVVESELTLDNIGGTLSVTKGGTGLTSVATGDILYASATDTLAALNAGTAGQVLTIVAGIPAWQTPVDNDTTYTAGTGINITGGNVIENTGVLNVIASGPLSSSGGQNPDISLTGVVPIANGGTNNTTFVTNELVTFIGGQLISSGVEFGDLVLDGEFLFDTAGDTGTSAIAQDGLVTFAGGTGIATADNGSGTITFTNTGDTTPDTIADDGVIDLGTETSGNYLANITSTGLTVTGTPGEGWTANIECADCILDTDDLWVLSADSGPDSDIAYGEEVAILGTTGRVVTVNDGADTVTIDVDETGLDINLLTGGPLEIANGGTNNTSFTLDTLTYFNGTSIVSTSINPTSVITTTNISSNAVTNVDAGNGLIRTGGPQGSITLDVELLTLATDGASATVSSPSGLEFVGGSNQLTLLQGCTTGDILKWNDTADEWECASDATGGTVNSFATWVPTAGDNVVASSPTDTMTLTNISGGLVITGTEADDELDFSLAAGAADGDILVWDNDTSTWNVVTPSGDVSVDDGGVFSVNSVQNDAVVLGTDTVGNYAGAVSGTGPISVTLLGSLEGGTYEVDCDDCLLSGGTTWTADADSGGTLAVTDTDIVDFAGGTGVATAISGSTVTFDVVESELTLNNIGGTLGIAKGGTNNTSFTSGDLVYYNGTSIVSTTIDIADVVTVNNIDSYAVTDVTAGNGLSLTGGPQGSITLDVELIGLGSGISSDSGLEFVSGALGLLQGCADGELLKWDAVGTEWECATDIDTDTDTTYTAGTGIAISLGNVISNTGVLSVGASGPLSSSGGQNPSISLTGIVPVANGGTNNDTYVDGQFLIWDNTGNQFISSGFDETDFALDGHTHATLSEGNGIVAFSYNGGAAATVTVDESELDINIIGGGPLSIENGGTGVDGSAFVDGELLAFDDTGDGSIVSTGILFGDILESGDTLWTADADGGSIIAVTDSTTVLFAGGTALDTTITGSTVTFDVDETAININNLSGILSVDNGGTGSDLTDFTSGTLTYFNGTDIVSTAINFGDVVTVNNIDSYAVTDVTAGNGLSLTGGPQGSVTLDVDLITAAGSGSVSSGSGLEFVGGALGLLQGCAADQVLKWDDANDVWECADDSDDTGNAFVSFVTPAGGPVVADSDSDTFTFTAGTGVLITGTAGSDTVDFSLDADLATIATLSPSSGQMLVYDGGWTNVSMSGDVTVDASGVTTIGADAVALGTDTTGNYVQSISGTSPIVVTGGTGEGSTPVVSCATCLTTSSLALWNADADAGGPVAVDSGDTVTFAGALAIDTSISGSTVSIGVNEGALSLQNLGGLLNLPTQVTGVLAIANGGTNNAGPFTAGNFIAYNGTSLASTAYNSTSFIADGGNLFSTDADTGGTSTIAEGDTLAILGDTWISTDDDGSGTITITHVASGITAGTYGSASTTVVFDVDAAGHITDATATTIEIDASQIISGLLSAEFGGTGLDGTSADDGQLLIGNGSGYTLATITAGTGISVVNGTGSITINNTGDATPDTIADDGVIALTTETSGNYVAGVTASGPLSITGTPGEGWTPNVECLTCVVDTDDLWTAVADDTTDADVAFGSSLTFNGGAGLLDTTISGSTVTFAVGAGNGITVSANGLSVDTSTTGTTATTFSNSGLESTASGVRMLGGCAAGDVLKWNAVDSQWECASDTTGGVDSFATWNTPAGTDPVADSSTDTVSLTSGTGLTVTGDATTDSVDFSLDADLERLSVLVPSAGQILVWDGTNSEWDAVTMTGDVAVNEAGVTVIQPNSVALGTDTTGNYVANVTASGPLSVTGTPGEGWTPNIECTTCVTTSTTLLSLAADSGTAEPVVSGDTVSIIGGTDIDTVVSATDTVTVNNTSTLASVTGRGATTSNAITLTGGLTLSGASNFENAVLSGASPLVFEGATADGFETSFVINDPTAADKTITFPNASGTVVVTASGPLSIDAFGDISCPTCVVSGSVVVRESDGSPSTTPSTIELGPVSSSSDEFIVTDEGSGVTRVRLGAQVGMLNENETVAGNWSFTGNVSFGAGQILGGSPFVLEGATNDANETVISIEDPTGDNVIAIPDASGTFAVSASGPITLSSAGDIGCATCLVSGGSLWTLAASSGSSATINQGDTATIAGTASRVTATGNGSGTVTIDVLESGLNINSFGGGPLTVANGGTGATTFDTDELISFDGSTLVSAGIDYNDVLLTGAALFGTAGNSGTGSIAQGQTLTVSGGTDISSTASGQSITVNNTSTLASVTGRGATTTTLVNLDGGIAVDSTNFTVDGTTGAIVTNDGLTVNGATALGDAATDAITFNGEILGGSPLRFEGASNDNVRTTVTVADPTGANSIVIPDNSGTFAVAGTGAIAVSAAGVISCATCVTAATDSFVTWDAPAGTDPVADSATDTMTLTAGTGLTITGNSATDTLAFSLDADLATIAAMTPSNGQMLIYNSGWTNASISGDVNISATGVASIQANSVALGTDTTGNYVADIAAGNGIAITGTPGEGWTPTVTARLLTIAADALSATTSNASGLEFISGQISLLQGCADGQILKWNETTDVWACGADTTGSSGNTFLTWDAPTGTDPVADSVTDTMALTAGTGVTITGNSGTDTLDFSLDADLAAIAVLSPSNGQMLIYNSGWTNVAMSGDVTMSATGVTTVGANAVALGTDTTGNYVADIAAGNGIAITGTPGEGWTPTVTARLLSAAADALSATTGNASGLEFVSSGQISLLQGCADGQILKWTESSDLWGCAADGGSVRWDQILSPTANLSLTMAANTSLFTYNAATGANNMYRLVDTASNTGTGYIFSAETAASSAAKPFRVVTRGSTVIDTTATGGLVFSPIAGQNAQVSLAAGSQFDVTGTAAPTVDLAHISNTGFGTVTNGVDGLQIDFITATTASVVDNAGLRINATSSAGGAGSALEGLFIANLTGAQSSVTEAAIKIGTGWDRDIEFADTSAVIVMPDPASGANSNTLDINDSAGNNLVSLRDFGNGNNAFGAALTAGAVISRNSYFGLEYSQFIPGTCGPSSANPTNVNSVRGDGHPFNNCSVENGNTMTIETTASGNGSPTCAWTSVEDTVNGIERQTASVTNSSGGSRSAMCMEFNGTNVDNNAHQIFDADNLPLMVMKVRPSDVSTAGNRVIVGLGDSENASTSIPDNGLFFTNCTNVACSTTSSDWQAVIMNGGTGTFLSCGVAISVTQFAMLRGEVRKAGTAGNSDVHFFVDGDVSNGITETECGSGSTAATPTVALAANMINGFSVGDVNQTMYLDIDYIRVWQDDNQDAAGSLLADGHYVGDGHDHSDDGDSIYDFEGYNVMTSFGIPYAGEGGEEAFQDGTLVSIDRSRAGTPWVKVTEVANDPDLIGVVVRNPGVRVGNDSVSGPNVAAAGRANVRVSSENGVIAVGDWLTSSSTPGVAMKSAGAGTVIGRVVAVPPAGHENPVVAVQLGVSSTSGTASRAVDPTKTNEEVNDEILADLMAQLAAAQEEPAEGEDAPTTTTELSVDRVTAGLAVISTNGVFDGLTVNRLTVKDAFSLDGVEIGRPYFSNDMGGFADIAPGDGSVEVTFDQPYEVPPVVNVSLTSDDEEGGYDWQNVRYMVTDKSADGFTIKLYQINSTGSDLRFNWIALPVKDPRTVRSSGTAPTPPPSNAGSSGSGAGGTGGSQNGGSGSGSEEEPEPPADGDDTPTCSEQGGTWDEATGVCTMPEAEEQGNGDDGSTPPAPTESESEGSPDVGGEDDGGESEPEAPAEEPPAAPEEPPTVPEEPPAETPAP